MADEGAVALVVLHAPATPADLRTRPVVAAARRGGLSCLVRPAELGSFLLKHSAARLVCEGSGPFHWSLEDHFRAGGEESARICLWELSKAGRLLDVILLDQLLDMAEHGVDKATCRFDEIARQRCQLRDLDPRDLQSRLDRRSGDLDPTIEQAALRLIAALMTVFIEIGPRADAISAEYPYARSQGQEIGSLSIVVQVRGAIAMAKMARGPGLVVEQPREIFEFCEATYRKSSGDIPGDPVFGNCFHEVEDGLIPRSAGGKPLDYADRLTKSLDKIVAKLAGAEDLPFRAPWSKPGKTSGSANSWIE